MSEALRAGKLGVMDYFQMKNVVADTDMRSAISRQAGTEVGPGDASEE
jgi:uncharacterized protein YqfA (UPF0365 family)